MTSVWKTYNTGFFTLSLPADWIVEEPRTGTLLLHDSQNDLMMTLLAVSRRAQAAKTVRSAFSAAVPPAVRNAKGKTAVKTAGMEAQFELQKWITSLDHVKVRQAPRVLTSSPQPIATTEGLQQLSAGVPWYKRLLRRTPLILWRFWAVLNPHILLLASCNGRPGVIEKHRADVDRIVASIQLSQRDILLGRHFTETVVSLARSYFPQMPVAAIDESHLRFGSQNISLSSLHRRYLAAPENLSTHVRAFLDEVQNELPASDLAGSWTRARKHILPTLLSPSAVEAAPSGTIFEEWINRLSIGYVLEEGGSDHSLTIADAKRWNVPMDALHDQAMQNLIARSHEQTMEGHKADGYTMLVLATPDKHNAARILLPELHRKLREHLGQTFYAALPTKEFLLAFSTQRDEVLSRVRQQIGADYSRAKEGLSNKLFLVTPDGIAGDPADAEDFDI